MHNNLFPQQIDMNQSCDSSTELVLKGTPTLPALIQVAGHNAQQRFIEFFTAEIRNPGTRSVYAHAVKQFCTWCEHHGVSLTAVSPFAVAAYIEQLTQERSAPTVKQHLSAIRRLFDWLVVGQVLPLNPAASVRGPKHVV